MSQSNTNPSFPSLGHPFADWLVNSKSKSRKAVQSQTDSVKMRQIFKTYLNSKSISTVNAHLIALSLRKNQDVYTGIQQEVWDTLDQTPVYIGAFDTSNKNAPILKYWAYYPSNFTQNFAKPPKNAATQKATQQNTTQADYNDYRKTIAKDGARILITIRKTANNWKEAD